MKLSKISYFTLMTGIIALNTTVHLSATAGEDRAKYLEKISEAVHNPSSFCDVPAPSGIEGIGGTLKSMATNDLYNSFKKLKNVATDDRVLYYLICGDKIKSQNKTIYDELFSSLTAVQKAALTLRTVVAAVKYPKVSCHALGLLGAQLESLSDIPKALICHACYTTPFPAPGSLVKMGMFEQLADWKAIMATCGTTAKKVICKQGYQESIPAGEFRNNLIAACKSRG